MPRRPELTYVAVTEPMRKTKMKSDRLLLPTYPARELVAQAVRATHGVKGIEDQLRVG
jgi:hypothetical protein